MSSQRDVLCCGELFSISSLRDSRLSDLKVAKSLLANHLLLHISFFSVLGDDRMILAFC